MSLKSLSLAIFLLLGLSLAPALVTPAFAQDGDMVWQFSESNELENKGATTARLIYGVPETDNVQVMGVCDARPSTGVKFASMTFGADIGDLANGADAELRFSGGGFEQTLKGNVQRVQEEGISGVHLDIENSDALWTAFAEKDMLDYQVPGYRAAPLTLEPGRDKIKSFVEACRIYEKAILGDQSTDTAAAPDDSAEKDAFESAKELGTTAAFEAFLANYPSGFYADLARAYVEKLKAAEAPAASAPAEAPPPAPSPKPVAAPSPSPDPSCKDLFKIKSQGSNAKAKITFVNRSGMYRSILWLDFSGQPKDYAGLNNGEDVTLDTFLTHPWMVADGPGDCIEIFMPHPGTRVVTLKAPDGSVKAAPAPAPKPKAAAPPPKPKAAAPPPKKTTKCRSRSVLIDGKCILKQNAQTYCGPGYRLQGNKCVQGYAKPKPQLRLPTWQLEAIKKGCRPGQGWNAQEGCHEND
jgi:von Hippel-Lindau disease tumor suppressor protein